MANVCRMYRLAIKAQYFMKACPPANITENRYISKLPAKAMNYMNLIIGIQLDLKYKYTYRKMLEFLYFVDDS